MSFNTEIMGKMDFTLVGTDSSGIVDGERFISLRYCRKI